MLWGESLPISRFDRYSLFNENAIIQNFPRLMMYCTFLYFNSFKVINDLPLTSKIYKQIYQKLPAPSSKK